MLLFLTLAATWETQGRGQTTSGDDAVETRGGGGGEGALGRNEPVERRLALIRLIEAEKDDKRKGLHTPDGVNCAVANTSWIH